MSLTSIYAISVDKAQALNSQKPAPQLSKVPGWLWLQHSMETNSIMTYKERLCCWAIARLLPSEQWIIVARFRSRSDADVKFEVVFDLSGDSHRLSALADRPSNPVTSAL